MTGASGALAVGVLGPLEVTLDDRPIEVGPGRLRTLLAALAMSAGKAVSVERLATALWDGEQPAHARRSVQTYLTRLRGALGADLIGSHPAGYLLRTRPERVDALQFAGLLDAAARAPDPASERLLLQQALSLWRGSPFAGLPSTWLERAEAPRLLERYLGAIERRIDLDVAEQRHGELVAQLYQLTAQHPLRESLWVRLLVALDRCGRQAEGLERYETIRVRLADELGTAPGPELQQAYAALLAGRPPQAPASHPPATSASPVLPRQLPADIDGFTGRELALKALHNLVGAGDDRAATAVVISAIAGTAGVGKTALAVHWAHQVADRFPDGQLYVNLRGHSPGPALTPSDAVRSFLDALGVPPQRVPSDLDTQTGLYRSLLAGKRMLVVLDNARDSEQVRPLLPGSATCLVVVTSRNQLTSLVATEAARPVILDLLPVDEARELLARRLGQDRIAAETYATDQIITSCARLPLALAIVAARAATNPALPLHLLAAQLRDQESNLDALTAGDPAADARAVFSWSYRTLSTEAARLFRLLGLHPGPETSAQAAASLIGLAPTKTRSLLTELTRAHLLTEATPDRYSFHDLLRAYAAELAHTHDEYSHRHTAQHRLLEHYLHTGFAAAALLNPQRTEVTPAQPQAAVHPEKITDYSAAMEWFNIEHRVLLAVTEHAAHTGFDQHAWQLTWVLSGFLDRCGHWDDWARCQHTALHAARRLEDRGLEAHAHRGLGRANSRLGRADDAYLNYRHALDLYQQGDDLAGQARTHTNLALLLEQSQRYPDALNHARQALGIHRNLNDGVGHANALNTVGWCYALVGDYRQTLTYCQEAIALHRQIDDRDGEAATWDTLGYAYHHLGDHHQAATCYQAAIRLFGELGDRYYESVSLIHLGDLNDLAGDPHTARNNWQRAQHILNQLGHPAEDEVHARLLGKATATGSAMTR